MHGFHGRYWRFDLSNGCGEYIPLPETVLRRYLGGVGLGAWLLHREAPPGVDPLAPEAPLIFSFSPLIGTPMTTSAKLAIVAKSPLTGMISDGLSGSHFAIAGKATGVDAIVLVGRCSEPSELINGVLRPTALWGRSAQETESALAAHGRVAAIGVAGENGVRYATISNDGRHAGRGGMGAVMGAKRLKALVVRGDVATPIAEPALVKSLARDLSKRSLGPTTAKYRELGTAANLTALNRIAALPTRNFQASQFDDAEKLTVEHFDREPANAPGAKRASCACCTIGCGHVYRFGGNGKTRVEYESLFALGSLCGISDPNLVLSAARRCDELGIDSISAGGTIAFAMECRERGYLPEAPEFGNGEAVLALLDDIAQRRGLGVLLAEGSRRAAIQVGRDALDFAPQVKGLELPGYEPRALQTLALGFAVGTRGADHNKSGAYELDFSDRVNRMRGDARAARLALETEDRAALIDSLILCKFLRGVFDDFYAETAAILAAITGWDVTAEELGDVARRIVSLRKAFNIREGWKPADDTLPARFLAEPLPGGPSEGGRIPAERLSAMIRSYNRARGWSDEGYVPQEMLLNLELDTHVKADR